MAGGDRRLEGVGTDGPAELFDPLDVRQAALDQQAVPSAAVLVEQQYRLAVRSSPGPQPGGLELDQREQAQRLGVGRVRLASIRPSRSASAHRSLRIQCSPLVAE